MSGDRLRDLPSPDGATSDANSSIQVHLDTSSHRGGLSTAVTPRSPSRHPSPSRTPEPSLGRQVAENSLSSFLSSQQQSQSSSSSQHERPSAEDLLRDLISPIDSSRNALTDPTHGLKRPHDGESAGEPLPKRDRLEEELEQMAAAYHEDSPSPPSEPEDFDSTSTTGPDEQQQQQQTSSPTGSRRVLPIRQARRRVPSPHREGEPSRRQGGHDNHHQYTGLRSKSPAK
ncbi:hypothetical protein B0T17DRAFT_506258 [Bombardia bombarda]|uniref:Uncharacterized protein n=1 Tax=Bombardia bombarda TaxID=252184 RepID=A0AA40C9Q4_9PEZI|nr:hypothetical protein B0T17DRAFT_506258 [Bombardia bombarda]